MADAADPVRKELLDTMTRVEAMLHEIRDDVRALRQDMQALADDIRRRADDARALSAHRNDDMDASDVDDGDSTITDVDCDE